METTGMSSKSHEGNGWDANTHYRDTRIARNYDGERFSSLAGRVFNDRERRLVRSIFARLLPAGARVADIPCGTGRLAEPLLEAGFRVHGMDISEQMLQVAHERLGRFGDLFSTEVADARSLAESDPRFDGVLCARVLMHFPLDEQIAFLRGVAALSRGPIVINHSFSSPYQRLRRRVKSLLGHQPSARFPITEEQVHRLLDACGLRETQRHRLAAPISEAVYIVVLPRTRQTPANAGAVEQVPA